MADKSVHPDNPQLKDHLTLAGIPSTLLEKARASGLSLQYILTLVVQYGPQSLKVLESILGEMSSNAKTASTHPKG